MGWSILGDIVGGLFDWGSTAGTAAMNYKIAKENREFQERMSNTALQRYRKDAEAAGFNPILGMSGGGASSPGGSALPVDLGKAGSMMQDSMLKAQSRRNSAQQLNNLEATEFKDIQQGYAAAAGAEASSAQAELNRQMAARVEAQAVQDKIMAEFYSTAGGEVARIIKELFPTAGSAVGLFEAIRKLRSSTSSTRPTRSSGPAPNVPYGRSKAPNANPNEWMKTRSK